MNYIDGNKINDLSYQNSAFLSGDAVKVFFFVRNKQLILAEDCYFFLMASMRKMRMNIPLSFTLEFFTEMFTKAIADNQFINGIITFLVFRKNEGNFTSKTPIHYYFELKKSEEILFVISSIEVDIIKEISVNNNLLSNIRTHSPENIYAEIYAKENDLDDVILLNPDKRIARSIFGNYLFLEENTIKIPKQTEGAYISPLMESFVTFVHKNQLASIEEVELSAFESQKSEEILMISDEKGIFSVSKIRNKTFGKQRFSEMIELWKNSLA